MLQWIKSLFFKKQKVSIPAKQEKSKLYRVVQNLIAKGEVKEETTNHYFRVYIYSGRYHIMVEKHRWRNNGLNLYVWSNVSRHYLFFEKKDIDVLDFLNEKIGLYNRFNMMNKKCQDELDMIEKEKCNELNNLLGQGEEQ